MSTPAVDDALVASLARSAVAQAAPEELPLFRATSETYFENPQALEQRGSGDQMLGFGAEAALVLVTPVALSVARDVLDFVVEQVRGHAREHGKDVIDRLADDVHDPAKRRLADRHGYRLAGVGRLHAADETVRRVHGDGTHRVFAEMLGNLENQVILFVIYRRIGHPESVVDGGEFPRLKFDVDNRADNLRYFPFVLTH